MEVSMFGSPMFTLPITPFNTALKSFTAALLVSSCLLILNGCDSQNISSESTVGSNNIAQTEPDIINRNSMQDVNKVNTGSEDSHNEDSHPKNSLNENSDNPNIKQ